MLIRKSMVLRLSGLLINRNFSLLWAGQAISNIGDAVFSTTLVLWVATSIASGQSWAPLAVVAVLLAWSIPTFLIGPLAGVFADRWDKCRTMLWMDGLRAILILFVLVSESALRFFLSTGPLLAFLQFGTICVVVFLVSVCTQFFNPARLTLIGDIVEEPSVAQASSLLQTMQSFSSIIGPPLAALLFFTVGVQWALLLNALSFVCSYITIRAIHVSAPVGQQKEQKKVPFFSEFRAGLSLFKESRVLRGMAVSVGLVCLGGGCMGALNVFYLTENLHAPAALYGWLGMASGAGLVAGAALAGIIARRMGVVRMYWLSVVGVGLVLMVYARLSSFVPALIVSFLLGLPDAAMSVAAGPLILQVTPRDFVGRILSIMTCVVSLATFSSLSIAGYLDSTVLRDFHGSFLHLTFGPIDTIYTGAGVLALLGGLYAMINFRALQTTRMGQPQEEAREAVAYPLIGESYENI